MWPQCSSCGTRPPPTPSDLWVSSKALLRSTSGRASSLWQQAEWIQCVGGQGEGRVSAGRLVFWPQVHVHIKGEINLKGSRCMNADNRSRQERVGRAQPHIPAERLLRVLYRRIAGVARLTARLPGEPIFLIRRDFRESIN